MQIKIFSYLDPTSATGNREDFYTLVGLRTFGTRINDAVCYVLSRQVNLQLHLEKALTSSIRKMKAFESSPKEGWKSCFRTLVIHGRHVRPTKSVATDTEIDNAARELLVAVAAFLKKEKSRFRVISALAYITDEEYLQSSASRYNAFFGAMGVLFLYSAANCPANHITWRLSVLMGRVDNQEEIGSCEFVVRNSWLGRSPPSSWDWSASFADVKPGTISAYGGMQASRQIPIFWELRSSKLRLITTKEDYWRHIISRMSLLEAVSGLFLRSAEAATGNTSSCNVEGLVKGITTESANDVLKTPDGDEWGTRLRTRSPYLQYK